MLKKLFAFFVFSTVICGAVAASQYTPVSVDFAAKLLAGPISGFVQIPAGGKAGSTSYRQPTFKDLGIKHKTNYDLLLQLNWQKWSIYGGYQNIRLANNTRLTKTIITHNITIPAGSLINPKVTLDWMRLGTQYNFNLNKKCIVAPKIEAVIMNFAYRIPGYITSRRFKQFTTRVGVYGNYNITQKFSLDGDVNASIPLLHLNIIDANLRAKYTIFKGSNFSTNIFAGIGYLYLRFKDQQPTPNYILYKQPSLQAGFIIGISK